MANTSAPRVLLNIVIQAFKQAQAARLQAERELKTYYGMLQTSHLRDKQAEQSQLEQVLTVPIAEQARYEELLQIVREIRQAGKMLLMASGADHINNIPIEPASLAKQRTNGLQAYAEAPDALVALQTAQFHLAQAHLSAGRWAQVQQIAASLLADTASPIYSQVQDLVRESYYRHALAALQAGQYERARQTIAPTLSDTTSSLYPKVCELMCEIHYCLAVEAMQTEKWELGRAEIRAALKIDANFRDCDVLLRRSYLLAAKEALEKGGYDEAIQLLTEWLNEKTTDQQAKDLLWDAYTGKSRHLIREESWGLVLKTIQELQRTAPDHPEIRSVFEKYPVLGWYTGQVKILRQFDDRFVQAISFSSDSKLLYTLFQHPDHYFIRRTWNVTTEPLSSYSDLKISSFSPSRRVKLHISGNIMAICDVAQKNIRVCNWVIDQGIYEFTSPLWSTPDPEEKELDSKFTWSELIVSQDGSLLAMPERSREKITIWRNGHLACTLLMSDRKDALKLEATTMTLSPDNRLLAAVLSPEPGWVDSAALNGRVKVWNLSSGQCIYQRENKNSLPGNQLCFSPNSQRLASLEYDTVTIWEVYTGSTNTIDIKRTNPCSKIMSRRLSFLPDSHGLLMSGYVVRDYEERIIQSDACLLSPAFEKNMSREFINLPLAASDLPVFSPYGKYLAVKNDSNVMVITPALNTEK